MLVATKFGHVQELSCVRADKSWTHPKPTFWANNYKEVIERAIDRAASLIHNTNVRISPTVFGWGDAGLGSIIAYDKVGEIKTLNLEDETTWTIGFYFGHTLHWAFEFTTKYRDTQHAKQLALEFLHV